MPLAKVCTIPQEPVVMSIPSVQQVSHNDHTYFFNGWVGEHEVTHRTLFEFEDDSHETIWVDVDGKFVCEK